MLSERRKLMTGKSLLDLVNPCLQVAAAAQEQWRAALEAATSLTDLQNAKQITHFKIYKWLDFTFIKYFSLLGLTRERVNSTKLNVCQNSRYYYKSISWFLIKVTKK